MELLLLHNVWEFISLHRDWVFSGPWWEELFLHHAWKLWELFFDEIEDFLRDESVDNESRAFLALKIKSNTQISAQIWDFLIDDEIDAYVKVKLSQRIVSWPLTPEVLAYLRDESKHWSSRWAIAMTLRWHNCLDILHLLENEQIDKNVRCALIDTVPINSTPYASKVLEFLWNKEISSSVREMLSLTLVENTSFSLIQNLLRSDSIPFNVRKTITWYCHFDFDEEIHDFLKDETIHYEVRMSVITSLNPVELSKEVLEFLQNEEVNYAVRFEFAFVIKKWEITPKAQDFINDASYDLNIRRNLLESLSSPIDIDIENLFDSLGLMKAQTQKSWEVNRWQCFEITGRTDICRESTRTLNFYYRQAQWSYDPQFEVISACIRHYIENGYSSVWNNYRIMWRHPHTQSLWNEAVTYKENMGFRSMSSIYADTIHLTHWSPESQIPWSHFILWNTITRDQDNEESEWHFWFEYKMDHVNDNQYTGVDLDYFWWNMWYFINPNLRNRLWIPDIWIREICIRVIRSLKKAEEKILANTSWTNKKVKDLLTLQL